MSEQDDVSGYLTRLADGRELTTEELAPMVYEDLRRLAHGFFQAEKPGATLQPTALVHEAYMKITDQRSQTWESRAHFLAMAATAMRRVLWNAAKARGRDKRGGNWRRVTLSEGSDPGATSEYDLFDLEAALEKLATVRERYVRIIELRYYGGLSLDEAAQVLGIGRNTVIRDWAKARSWLATYLEDAEGESRPEE